MSYIELIILAISLCFDTFAVSISGGIKLPHLSLYRKFKIIISFGIFQAAFLFLGWLVGYAFSQTITKCDHWIAFVILSYLGMKMVLGVIKNNDPKCNLDDNQETSIEEQEVDLLSPKKLCILAIATSIDALAVGVSLAFISLPLFKIGFTTFITIMVTALASYIGISWGQKLGCVVGKRAELMGGLILIAIGVKILVEHLFF